MQKLKINLKLVLAKAKKRNINVYIFLIGIFLVTILILNSFFNTDISSQKLSKNIAYVQVKDNVKLNASNFQMLQTIPLNNSQGAEENSIDVLNPFSSNLKINLEDMEYVPEVSKEIYEENQKLIDKKEILHPNIAYNLNSKILNDKNISLHNENYGIDKVIIGNYPQNENEVLIGETTANYYINKLGLKHYDELLNKKIKINTEECDIKEFCINKEYTVSGIYRQDYSQSMEELLIINPSAYIKSQYLKFYNEVPKAYFLKFKTSKQMEQYIEENNSKFLKTLTYKDTNKLSIKLIIEIILILILNLLLFIILKKDLKTAFFKLDYYGYLRILNILIILIPFLLLNISLLIILYFL